MKKKEQVKLFASFQKAKADEEKQELEIMEKRKEAEQKKKDESVVSVKMGSYKRLLFCFVLAAALFGLCLFLIKRMTAQELTVPIVVASEHISKNEIIADSSKLVIKEIPVSLVPENAIKNISDVQGMFSVCDIGKNQILTNSLFTNKKDAAMDMEEPVEIAIGVKNIDQMVGGIIREGDLVNISVVKQEGVGGDIYYETNSIIENAYVTRTFTVNGTNVESQDQEQSVVVINILIPSDKEDEYNAALFEGTIRVARVCQ